MRIVIDLQAAQSASRMRGIGRYSMALTEAIIRNRNNHQIYLVLNGLFSETIEPIRAAFEYLLPQENIKVWYAPGPVAYGNSENHWRRRAAEKVREVFLASLQPDVVLISSLFEGFLDNAVTSVEMSSRAIPTAVILYDLIPYLRPDPYLNDPVMNTWYREKVEHLRQCDLWLSISESSRQEGIEHLKLAGDRIVNISSDADAYFQSVSTSAEKEASVRTQYALNRSFIMYTGGDDHRKNFEGLIRAFAKLPKSLRDLHQLAIVANIQPETRRKLENLVTKLGMEKDDVVLTGYVPDDQLLTLYNLCLLFVFPSLHEGFGLPVLEAMRCGAPVIGSNTSSLPEVIGWEEALFDPLSDDEMAALIERVLSDEKFRQSLIENGKARSEMFSWDKSAVRAIEAMEQIHSTWHPMPVNYPSDQYRPKLAFVSPLPPERSGISDYSADLLPVLSKYYQIDVIVSQEQISDAWISKNCRVRSVSWLIEHAHEYDRVLYHFGNSPFHQHMFNLLREIPGVVVLHDFFLSGLVCHLEFDGIAANLWSTELYKSHGYKAVYERFHCIKPEDVVMQYPCSLTVIQESLGMIVHSDYSLNLMNKWFGGKTDDWAVIPLLKHSQIQNERVKARAELGFKDDDILVCTFGMLAPTKLNEELISAWGNSCLAGDKACHLIFVGENHGGDYGKALLSKISRTQGQQRIHITGWIESDLYQKYLAAADIAVQLRSQSRGETSASVLDCMNYGLPTIVNANGSMAVLNDDAVYKLPDNFACEQLTEALDKLRLDKTLRQCLGEAARNIIIKEHNPQKCAERYKDAIESFYHSAVYAEKTLPDSVADIADSLPDNLDLIQLAESIAKNVHPRNRKKQLLVDISVLVHGDEKTGIQRVVRSILWRWLLNPPDNFRIEPVYATPNQTHRYARSFTSRLLGIPDGLIHDEVIDCCSGDIFLSLDLNAHLSNSHQDFYQKLRDQGAQVKFIVYDLLPIVMPHYFIDELENVFKLWLETVVKSDGAICISQSVAKELQNWIEINGLESERLRSFNIDWFHLGADIDNSHPSAGLPLDADKTLQQITSRPSFLMVGTVEPRKGHSQVIDAFERLWQSGVDANLVIVGKLGWKVEVLLERLKAHPDRSKKLFWLEGISDEYLEKIYAASDCLIAASYGEGFGLPLIEAAQHKLPIIARDIPVFREVAAEYAYYFDSEDSEDLARAIEDWIQIYEKGQHPTSDNMPWLTWEESAAQLLNVVRGDSESSVTLGNKVIS